MRKVLTICAVTALFIVGIGAFYRSFKKGAVEATLHQQPDKTSIASDGNLEVPQQLRKSYVQTDLANTHDDIIGSYAVEDLAAALDDYYKISMDTVDLLNPSPKYVEALHHAFNTDSISEIDVKIHQFLFDNAIPREQKIGALWKLALDSEDNVNKQDYLIDTLDSLCPIELTDELIEYNKLCTTDNCAVKTLDLLANLVMMPASDYEHFTPLELEWMNNKIRKIEGVFERSLNTASSEPIFEKTVAELPQIFGNEKATQLLDRLPEPKSDRTALITETYLNAVLGSDSSSFQMLERALDQVENNDDLKYQQDILSSICSVVMELPLREDFKPLIKSYLEKHEPLNDAGPTYFEWIIAYSQLVQESNSPGLDREKALQAKFSNGTDQFRVSMINNGQQYLNVLSRSQMEGASKSIQDSLRRLAPQSEQWHQYSAALETLEATIRHFSEVPTANRLPR